MAGDKTKPQIHLIPSEAILGIAQALTFGVVKHGRYEFRASDLTHTEIIDSLMRHTLAYLAGEDNDPETGYPHTWHLGANYAMLEWKRIHQPELDDRYKKQRPGDYPGTVMSLDMSALENCPCNKGKNCTCDIKYNRG